MESGENFSLEGYRLIDFSISPVNYSPPLCLEKFKKSFFSNNSVIFSFLSCNWTHLQGMEFGLIFH